MERCDKPNIPCVVSPYADADGCGGGFPPQRRASAVRRPGGRPPPASRTGRAHETHGHLAAFCSFDQNFSRISFQKRLFGQSVAAFFGFDQMTGAFLVKTEKSCQRRAENGVLKCETPSRLVKTEKSCQRLDSPFEQRPDRAPARQRMHAGWAIGPVERWGCMEGEPLRSAVRASSSRLRPRLDRRGGLAEPRLRPSRPSRPRLYLQTLRKSRLVCEGAPWKLPPSCWPRVRAPA